MYICTAQFSVNLNQSTTLIPATDGCLNSLQNSPAHSVKCVHLLNGTCCRKQTDLCLEQGPVQSSPGRTTSPWIFKLFNVPLLNITAYRLRYRKSSEGKSLDDIFGWPPASDFSGFLRRSLKRAELCLAWAFIGTAQLPLSWENGMKQKVIMQNKPLKINFILLLTITLFPF